LCLFAVQTSAKCLSSHGNRATRTACNKCMHYCRAKLPLLHLINSGTILREVNRRQCHITSSKFLWLQWRGIQQTVDNLQIVLRNILSRCKAHLEAGGQQFARLL
jgi:hypothetical protein